mgnify:CR=1 FL=1
MSPADAVIGGVDGDEPYIETYKLEGYDRSAPDDENER